MVMIADLVDDVDFAERVAAIVGSFEGASPDSVAAHARAVYPSLPDTAQAQLLDLWASLARESGWVLPEVSAAIAEHPLAPQ